MSVALLAGVLLAGLVAVPGSPAGAQDITDLPRLGYEISPTHGFVGDEVHSQVNPSDVQEHCWDLALADVNAYFSGAITAHQLVTSFVFDIWSFVFPSHLAYPYAASLGPEVAAAWEEVYGPPPTSSPVSETINAARTAPPPGGIPNNTDGANFVNWVNNAVLTAFGFGANVLAGGLYDQVHITTFVDPVTQEMLGETGNFSPETGEGTMLVPDLDPALYAVAAACAFFVPPDEFIANWDTALVSAWDYSVSCEEQGGQNCFPTSEGQAGWQTWAEEGGFAALLEPVLGPRAIGLDFYCILQDDGFCATPPGPVGLIDEDVLDEFNGDDPLAPVPGAEGLEDLAEVDDLVAVQATPSFTG